MTVPFGAWPSPISAADVARTGRRLSSPAPVGDEVWWSEGRPEEGGRATVVAASPDGRTRDLLPAPWYARTRVHEYGGRAWLATDDGVLVFAEFSDQRLYRLDPGADAPVPLTPAGQGEDQDRFADLGLTADGTSIRCVREAHRGGKIRRAVVEVPLDGSGEVKVIAEDGDFLAFPRLSPDGRRLAWLTWSHPNMPWDGAEVRVAELGEDGTAGEPRTVLGGPAEAALQPEWAGPDELYALSDRTGWWNLYRVPANGGEPAPLHPAKEEFGGPLWQLGTLSYVPLADGTLLVSRRGGRLGRLDPATGDIEDYDLPYTSVHMPAAAGGTAAFLGGSPIRAPEVVRLDLEAGTARPLRGTIERTPDAAYLPAAERLVLPGPGGRPVHAVRYAPAHPYAQAPAGELPPYVVFVHGGPTSSSPAVLDLEKAYFTSRGIGVLDVDYGGSSGYGREYRERLRGQWGVVDVEDSVHAVLALADRGEADRARLAIRGGSAGGWTVLAALTGTDVFAAGTSYYGVAELQEFVSETHDFESRYIDGLIGPLPEARDLYVERAPLSHVDDLSCPVLLLQGAEDPVVPPNQAEMFAKALAVKGIPYAYLLFPGESHGFRKAETVIACLQAELSFYGQVMSFDPPGVPVLELEG